MSDGDRALQDPVAGSTNSGAGLPPRSIQNSTLTVERIAGRRSSTSIQEETVNDIPSSTPEAPNEALRCGKGGRKSSVSFDEDAAEAAAPRVWGCGRQERPPPRAEEGASRR